MLMLGLLLPCEALAQPPIPVYAQYESYAAGFPVARFYASYFLGEQSYWGDMIYQTTGLVRLFMGGYQHDHAEGVWSGHDAVPSEFIGIGHWSGQDRLMQLDYHDGNPVVRAIKPPNAGERQSVPNALRMGTVDTVSAIVQLLRSANETGRCEGEAHTFDGRRATDIEAYTVGEEVLAPTGRSIFSGPALHCRFEGRMLAGFRTSDNPAEAGRVRHGSAWLARVVPGGPLMPVRVSFENDWVGATTLYLTAAGPDVGPEARASR